MFAVTLQEDRMNRNKFSVIVLILSLSLASATGQAAVFKNSVGAGIQYGGVFGWQGAFHFGRNRLRGALGLAGTAWGYDRFLGSHYSLGAQIFGNQFRVGGGLSFHYHLSQQLEPGFVFGLDVYRGSNTQDAVIEAVSDFFLGGFFAEGLGIDAEVENGVFVSVGYQF